MPPLSRTNLADPAPHASLNPCLFMLLQTLCRRQKTQPLCNQSNPNSFCKIPGAGYPECFYGTPEVGDVRSYSSLATRHFLLPLCFHTLTNPFFPNPFLFTSIQNPGGVGLLLPLQLCALCVSVANPIPSVTHTRAIIPRSIQNGEDT
jgi:hypothetical protein